MRPHPRLGLKTQLSAEPSSGRAFNLHSTLCQFLHSGSQQGSALLIVLAFVVLLTGLLLAFFNTSLNNQKLSSSSSNGAKVELFAQGAIDSIIRDLKQEIITNSSSTTITTGSTTTTIYSPKSTTNVVPSLVGSTGTNGLQNLVKISTNGMGLYSGGTHIAVNDSTTNASKNSRSISAARWNKPLLIPPTSTNDLTPTNTFIPPYWILIARDGSNPTNGWNANMVTSPTNPTTVIGRYAYAIYDEGGLLDANVAGYPSTTVTNQSAGTNQSCYRPALAYADLTQIGLTTAQIDQLVGWRNYATTQPSGTVGSLTMSAGSATKYYNYVQSNSSGFLTADNTNSYNSQSDRKFTSRQQLISFLQNGLGLPATNTAYQYLGTFSRDVNQPSVYPDLSYILATGGVRPKVKAVLSGGNTATGLDDQFNPIFLNTRVANQFTRYDGTIATPGDPLVKSRFPLSRLAWITCDGPSASLPTSDPRYNSNGTVANILKCFGLTWTPNQAGTYYVWNYNHGNTQRILQLGEVAALSGANAREPDFFELLQAAISVGSLGKSFTWVSGGSIPYRMDEQYFMTNTALDLKPAQPKYQTLQIAASIIDQADTDDYPTEITVKDVNNNEVSLYGVENIPYLYEAMPVGYQRRAPGNLGANDQGSFGDYMICELWNPHDIGYINSPSPDSGLSPTSFQIQFQTVGGTMITGVYEWNNGSGGNIQNATIYGDKGTDATGTAYGTQTNTTLNSSTTTPQFSYMNFSVANVNGAAGSFSDPAVPNGATIPATGISGNDLINSIPMAIFSFTSTSFNIVAMTKVWPITNELINNLPAIYATNANAPSATIPTDSTKAVTTSFIGNFNVSLGYVRSGVTHLYSKIYDNTINGNEIILTSSQKATDLTNTGSVYGSTLFVQWSDPRSDRFPGSRSQAPYYNPYFGMTMRPDTNNGAQLGGLYAQTIMNNTNDIGTGVLNAGWTLANNNAQLGLLGLNQVNAADSANMYYTDPDGVLRGADGMYEVSGNLDGQALAINTNASFPQRNYSRPIVLNRPFRNVGELGYVFRGAPWKTLDFFSANSGDSALLDVFCINEPTASGLSAGVINLNTRNAAVLQAVINGSLRDETPTSGFTTSTNQYLNTLVANIATNMTSLTATNPFASRGDLVTKFVGTTNYPSFVTITPGSRFRPASTNSVPEIVKRRREASVRALNDISTTRVWNLMIDVVVQTGKFPPGTTSLTGSFVVEGEKRYWIHVAIDRATGQVIDKSTELVTE